MFFKFDWRGAGMFPSCFIQELNYHNELIPLGSEPRAVHQQVISTFEHLILQWYYTRSQQWLKAIVGAFYI